jgi:hypothetical protein
LDSLVVGTDGQVLLGATAADAQFGTLTSSGGTIMFTPGPNALNLEAVLSPSSLVITADSGTASPALGNLNVFGGDSITTSGSADTITASVTGCTQYSPQMGSASGALADIGVMTTGQVMVGVTGSAPNLTTLTAGSGISIDDTGSPGEITISASGAGSGAVKITTFTMSGTFTKDTGSKMIDYYIWSAGGGGGSGGRHSSIAGGGGGGGVIGYTVYSLPSVFVGATETVTIGAGGAGGAAITANNTAGHQGAEAGHSEFGTTHIVAGGRAIYSTPPFNFWGGGGGNIGSSPGTASGGDGGAALYYFSGSAASPFPPTLPQIGDSGAAGSVTGGSNAPTLFQFGAATGGGGAGGINVATATAGGNGGIVGNPSSQVSGFSLVTYGSAAAGGAAGVNGADGADALTNCPWMTGGFGAGGGGGHATAPGHGGDGGFPGAGGGGGGGVLNGNNSGAGGNGGDGQIIIIEYLG